MKKIISLILVFSSTLLSFAQNRFPKPDFESGYQYPDHHIALPNEQLWLIVDIIMLVALMGFVAWATIKKQTRKPVIYTSIISVAYFGFFREGCVCSIGAIQNATLALADSSYVMPLSVFLFFILPIVFAFIFGRVFCAGVCPFGALQELLNVKNVRISKALNSALSIIPWVYLIFAILYAATRTSFIICEFDPFVGIFRLSGDIVFISFGIILLVMSLFVGRPFCRFLCPYGAILSLFSKASIYKVKITKKECINCELCNNACPVDAIKAPYENKTKEKRSVGVKRIIAYGIILPVLIFAGAFTMRHFSDNLSRANKTVALYDMVTEHEKNPQELLTIELEAFYAQDNTIEDLEHRYNEVLANFKLYSTFAGALIGLVIALALINLSLKRSRREYEIDNSDCVSCGRCFSYCPQNK